MFLLSWHDQVRWTKPNTESVQHENMPENVEQGEAAEEGEGEVEHDEKGVQGSQ